ncbi:MAG TPA: GGDEF domain-containing protein [Candidatus Dormibacteraeota bacterium]|nr:GGDEF domain-containing protein [Candidatus Dormibacteraeota bacterium]
MIKVNRKIFTILYRLTLPGSLLLVFSALLIRVGVLADPQAPLVKFLPVAVFGVGLALSAFFRRSRLFFALLALTLAHSAFAWVMPHLSAGSAKITASAIAILLPLNLLVLAFLRERGIISPAGRRRLAMVALQVMGVAILCMPAVAQIAAQLTRAFIPPIFSQWSGLSQPALLAFILAIAVMTVLLLRRYKAVESSLLWSVVAAFIALRAAGISHLDGVYFAAGGLALIVALIETSYAMAYLDELTQLPSRRSLNEALLKLGETYSIAMLDVDHFKKFNDSYGHESGDQALKLVASRLSHITGGGKAYRYGGEEFAIVFPNKSSEEVFVYLDRMRRVIEQSVFTVRGADRRRKGKSGIGRGSKKQTNVTVSIGLAATNGDKLAPAEVLRMADQALYKAKAKGRNCTITARLSKSAVSVQQPSMRVLSVS